MPNLKLDLINKLGNDKYYAELELGRLAQDPTMNYKEKIELMQSKLAELAILNGEIALAGQYFPDQVAPQQVQPEAAPAQAQQPQGQVHPGQTFGE